MELIQSLTVGSGGAASITFSSIPATYTDLVLISSARHTSGTEDFLVAQLNGTTSGYSQMYLGGNGSSVRNFGSITTIGFLVGDFGGSSYTANTFQISTLTIPNYASTNTKICVANGGFENNGSTGIHAITTSRSTVTAAITSILIRGVSFNLAEHSRFSLYGVLKGSGGATV
jgi:hypothetical protein